MLIFDESGNVLDNPDLTCGRLEERERVVVHEYVVEVEEISHEEVVAEYPETGGKDVAVVVDVEERGRWEARLKTGEPVVSDAAMPEGMPRDEPIKIVEPYLLYVRYTKEELAEIAEAKAEAERARADAEAREAYLAGAPVRTAALEAGQEESMDALAELGALAADSAVTLEDVLNAVAELGAMVAGEEVAI